MPISEVVLMTHEYNNYRKSQKPVFSAPELKATSSQTASESKNAPEPKRDPVREVLAIMMPF